MKSTAVDESLSSMNQQFCSRENQLLQLLQQNENYINPGYDIIIKRLHLYYYMKLDIFRIERNRNLLIQFSISVDTYTQQLLTLYQLERVPVAVIDKNTKADSYTQLQLRKPYLALNIETYINGRQQELSTCKRIGYEFFWEELSVVRHKSIHSCKSAIFLT